MSYLYNSLGKKIIYNNDETIDSGAYATTYKGQNNLCIKVWNSDGLGTLDCNTFKYIKKLNLPNYYYLRSMLYSSRKEAILRRNPCGYYYPYIKSEDIDILTMPVSYTLDNLDGLFRSICILTSRNIRCIDLQAENVILNKEGITAIDIDLYSRNCELSMDLLKKYNFYDLENLFIDLYFDALRRHYLDNDKLFSLLSSLFMIYDYDGIQGVSKKLKKYKYPIDYIKKYKSYY